MAMVLSALGSAALAQAPTDTRRSGTADMSPALQAMQRDSAAHPAALWLADGAARFESDCARCHGPRSLRDVAARYPAFDVSLGRPVTLARRIARCREKHARHAPLPIGSDELVALETYVASLAAGLPIAPPPDPRLASAREQGARLWQQRFGQLDLSCATCHDANAGRKLAGSTIPQAHPTGYPIYRLEWQGMGGLQRRFRNCMTGVRAEPFAFDSAEFTALEAYLMQRAAGMALEVPAVRP